VDLGPLILRLQVVDGLLHVSEE
jgi:hypothetical protein